LTGGSARQLIAFSLNSKTVNWRSTGQYVASPVVGGSVVYSALANPERVEARRASDGSLLWSWAEPTMVAVPSGQAQPSANHAYTASGAALIVTNNLLFYSSSKQVHALDLATRQRVWSFPRAGDLSMSANGTLLIASSQGPGVGNWLTAFNLR
jgi:outer membrane protein assembly factor BamB